MLGQKDVPFIFCLYHELVLLCATLLTATEKKKKHISNASLFQCLCDDYMTKSFNNESGRVAIGCSALSYTCSSCTHIPLCTFGFIFRFHVR